MAPEPQEDAGPSLVRIGVCSTCRLLFLVSEDRQTSPCCGADPLVALATLTLGPGAEVTGAWGLGLEGAPAEETEEPAPAAAPLEEPPAEEGEEGAPAEEVDNMGVLLEGITGYLSDAGVTGDDVHTWLMRMGADPERAATAVGRLEAVREELRRLAPAPEPVSEEPATPEAEIPPENT